MAVTAHVVEETVVIVAKTWIANSVELVFIDFNSIFKESLSDKCLPYCKVIIISKAKKLSL